MIRTNDHFLLIGILVFLVIGLVTPVRAAETQESNFRFLATGDVPYSKAEEIKYGNLLEQAATEDFAFLMHVGDIKSGGTPCTDEQFAIDRDLFQKFPAPVVYTFGDNEWTDCHGVGSDPIERLAKLRELFFEDKTVLRLAELNAVQQSCKEQFARYIENYRFTKGGVLFIVVHVCGSGNNRRTDNPAAMKEFTDRNAANLAFLEASFAEALTRDVSGVAVVIHANPDFEQGRGEGFHDFLASMRGFLAKYHRPVVCIHGDSHYYRIDKPFRDLTGTTYLHFTRMEVFGAPNVAGVVVGVDRNDPEVFSFRPYYLLDE